jgi:spore coat polysaccharide biosynthesis predicted glycosyltransferase SpsG
VLLRDEFSQEPWRIIRERVERVFVTTGGGDPFNLSPRLIRLVHDVLSEAVIDVIVGPYFTRETIVELERIALEDPRIVLHRDPSDIRSIMLGCDIAVTGGGQTTYELAATGTPTVAIRLADNQIGNLQGLAAQGTLLWAGDAGEPNLQDKVRQAMVEVAKSPEVRERMSRSGRRLVDGRGAIRVAEQILQLCCEGQRQ